MGLNTFHPSCREKFLEYIANGRFDARWTIEECLERTREWWIEPKDRHVMTFTFGLKSVESVWMRTISRGPNFQLFFIGADNQVIEICSYRTLRQLRKKWYQKYLSTHPEGMPEEFRLESIFKHKWQTKIQGGLIKQEKRPRKTHWHDAELAKKPWEMIDKPKLP